MRHTIKRKSASHIINGACLAATKLSAYSASLAPCHHAPEAALLRLADHADFIPQAERPLNPEHIYRDQITGQDRTP
ncbi:hypothetical protein [Novosphingobium sp. 9]|uniref:hypothetical protein n=1 Tax=Novosphingobium sp. 9 TaxID=2025349 RepID=UPI0021B5C26C|nr:hypothetical protein [Novosphingobium sp. 9]